MMKSFKKRSVRLPGSTSVLPVREHEGGYLAEGPGFYIWDEDPAEVVRVARLLESGATHVRGRRLRIARGHLGDSGEGGRTQR